MLRWSILWRGAVFRRDALLVALIALCAAWLGLWTFRPPRPSSSPSPSPPSNPAAVVLTGLGQSDAPADRPAPPFDPHFQKALDARQAGALVLVLLLGAAVVALAFVACRAADEFALFPGCAAIVAFVSAVFGHAEAHWGLALLAAAASAVIWHDLFRRVGLVALPRAIARRLAGRAPRAG